jgi:hypothetical protein
MSRRRDKKERRNVDLQEADVEKQLDDQPASTNKTLLMRAQAALLEKLSSFDGSGDVVLWIDEWTYATSALDEATKLAFLRLKLSGVAADEFRSFDDDTRTDVGESLNELKLRFARVGASTAFEELLVLHQKPEEPVPKYFMRLRSLARRAGLQPGEQVVVLRAWRGLSAPLAGHVAQRASAEKRTPLQLTLQELEALAQQKEAELGAVLASTEFRLSSSPPRAAVRATTSAITLEDIDRRLTTLTTALDRLSNMVEGLQRPNANSNRPQPRGGQRFFSNNNNTNQMNYNNYNTGSRGGPLPSGGQVREQYPLHQQAQQPERPRGPEGQQRRVAAVLPSDDSADGAAAGAACMCCTPSVEAHTVTTSTRELGHSLYLPLWAYAAGDRCQPTFALVDTGSHATLVSSSMLTALPSGAVVAIHKEPMTLRSASAHIIKSNEVVELKLDVRTVDGLVKPINITAHVVEALEPPIIIGAETLTSWDAKIAMALREISLSLPGGSCTVALRLEWLAPRTAAIVTLQATLLESTDLPVATDVMEPVDLPHPMPAEVDDVEDACARVVAKLLDTVPPGTLDEQQHTKLSEGLKKMPDALLPSFEPDRRAQLGVCHRIDVGDAQPIASPPYRVSRAEDPVVEEELRKLLTKGIITPSSSPWAANLVVVDKKDGTKRLCVDYRKLNAVTKADKYPLPRIDDLLDKLQRAKLFSTLDLKSGYYQIPLDAADREKTAFVCRQGLYEFSVMPFGLVNAPATFQRTMAQVLQPVLGHAVLVYLDDIVVFSPDVDTHVDYLLETIRLLEKSKLFINQDKCYLLRKNIEFLGYVVSEAGLAPSTSKTLAVRAYPRPTSVTEVRRFLGLTNFYRRFISSYSKLAEPLVRLTRKDVPFLWNNECHAAFHALIEALCTAPVLTIPPNDDSVQFVLATDASTIGIGATLLVQPIQKDSLTLAADQCRVVAYHSRTLDDAERRYTTSELECLALVDAIKAWRHYLDGTTFLVVTDHESLRFLHTIGAASRRLQRWALTLQGFSFGIIHRAGKAMEFVDALSRAPLAAHAAVRVTTPGQSDKLSEAHIKKAQARERCCVAVKDYLENRTLPPNTSVPSPAEIVVLAKDMIVMNGVLVQLWAPRKADSLSAHAVQQRRVWLPTKELQEEALRVLHDDLLAGAHLGYDRTVARLRERFWWPTMLHDTKQYIAECVMCAARKKPTGKPPGQLQSIVATYPLDVLAVDLVGPLPETKDGNRYILTATDLFTKYGQAYAIKDATALTFAKTIVEQFISRFGSVKQLLSDQGGNFLADLSTALYEVIKAKKLTTTGYHPQCNGQVERFHQVLYMMLSMFVNQYTQNDWDEYLHYVCFAYNTSTHHTTGVTPHLLFFGRDPILPVDIIAPNMRDSLELITSQEYVERVKQNMAAIFAWVRGHTQQAKDKQRRAYDAAHRDVEYGVGQRVWVFSPAVSMGLSKKLAHLWSGPWVVTKQRTKLVYEVAHTENAEKKDVVHILRLKPCHTPQQMDFAAASEGKTEEVAQPVEYEVERILDMRLSPRGSIEYLVKWRNWAKRHSTWEPEEHLEHAQDSLRQFLAARQPVGT